MKIVDEGKRRFVGKRSMRSLQEGDCDEARRLLSHGIEYPSSTHRERN